MQQLEPLPKEKRRHCRRSKSKDEQSWRKGASKGGRSRWALRKLPPIDPENPLP